MAINLASLKKRLDKLDNFGAGQTDKLIIVRSVFPGGLGDDSHDIAYANLGSEPVKRLPDETTKDFVSRVKPDVQYTEYGVGLLRLCYSDEWERLHLESAP